MIKPVDVAHVTSNVTDLARSVKFYTELLGFHVSGNREGVITWLNIVASSLPDYAGKYL